MIFITCASSMLGGNRRRSRVRKSFRATLIGRLADTLFFRRVGVVGTLGRLGLLMAGAVFSYFVGTGLAELMLKAPIGVALMFCAFFFALAGSDTDRA